MRGIGAGGVQGSVSVDFSARVGHADTAALALEGPLRRSASSFSTASEPATFRFVWASSCRQVCSRSLVTWCSAICRWTSCWASCSAFWNCSLSFWSSACRSAWDSSCPVRLSFRSWMRSRSSAAWTKSTRGRRRREEAEEEAAEEEAAKEAEEEAEEEEEEAEEEEEEAE